MSDFSSATDAFERGDLKTAREYAQSAVDSDPAPRWHHLLGLIDCREGQPAKGVEHLQTAVDGEPGNAAFQAMLARALIDCGRFRDVLDMAEPGEACSPATLALWHTRAEAGQRIGDAAAAIIAWRAIANARPGEPRGWINLARLLLHQRQYDEAEQAYRRALELAPADADASGELALLYDRTGKADLMAEVLERAASSGVGRDRLPLAWAALEYRRGNSNEALELLSSPASPKDPIRWHAFKAKVQDSLGNTREAFDEMVAMNRATPNYAEWRRRAASYRSQLRRLAQSVTPAWGERIPTLEPERPQPVFLLGFPRSGTTLLDTFLMGHRAIEVIEEQPLLFDSVAEIGGIEKLPAVDADTLRKARDRYTRGLAKEARESGCAVVIDKFPLNMVAAPLIHALFPGAPILFAQRHPCDCVLSGFMQAFVANLGMASFLDIADAADFYDVCMSVWTASCVALPLNVHIVRYESLVENPEATLRPVIEFLGLDWDEKLLDHQRTAVGRGHIPNTSYDQVTRPLNTAAVERWRRYEEELAPVLVLLLGWARRHGYED
jgi:Flp pilus assembly protein TadD